MDMIDYQYNMIVEILGKNHYTTLEVEERLKVADVKCPDDLARTLNIMRRKGIIKGALSPEKGAWVWWAEE